MPERTREQRFREEMCLLADEAQAWDGIHKGVTEKVEFLLDGQHYKDNHVQGEKDSEEIRWVGEEGFDRYRHELARVTEAGTLSARPVDLDGDADLAEVASRLMLSETENPAKEFEDNWEDVVGAATVASYGAAWLDFLPHEGPWGEIIFSSDDPRNFMCDRRVKSVHSPRCRFVIRKVRMTIAEAKRRAQGKGAWNKKLVEQLKPDSGHDSGMLGTMRDALESDRFGEIGQSSEPMDANSDRKEITVYYIWKRHSDETEGASEDYTDLEEDDRYMRCNSCGYRSEPQHMLKSQGKLKGELPEELQGGCPECMDARDPARLGDMVRVDGYETKVEMLAYPKGYLCILAPYALPGVQDFLYEGPWPYKLRSYPCTFLPRFRHPFRIVGPSITDLIWWNQIATDMMMRLALERMVTSAPFMVMPRDGLEDAVGRPFENSDENGWKAFYTGDAMPKMAMVGGDPGIPAVWNQTYQAARQALTAHSGRADFALSDDQSRNIPASSVALQVKQEEVPVEHFKRRYQRQRGLLIGVYFDMMRAVYPAERLYRLLGEDGVEAVRALASSDLPNFDFHFDTTPDFLPQDAQKAQSLEMLLQTIETRPYAVDIVAEVNKFSPSIVRKAKERFQQQQEQAAQAQAQAAAQAVVPGGPASPAPQTGSQMAESLMAGLG